MKHEVHFDRKSERFCIDLKPFEAAGRRLPVVQAHSPLHSHELSARHPQIGQRKQRHQLRRVLGQALVAHLGKAELALDDLTQMFHLGPNTGLKFLDLFAHSSPGRVLLYFAFARTHGHLPLHASGVSIHTNMDLHAEVESLYFIYG
jgi:hypothetical protein